MNEPDETAAVADLAGSRKFRTTATPAEWVPEFPGQRPPFQPGNEVAVVHGAYSDRKLQPVAQRLMATLLDRAASDSSTAYLAQPDYLQAVEAWAVAEARVQLLEDWCNAMSLDESTGPRRKGATAPLEMLRKWEATAATHRQRLGLDPLSRAKLGKDVAAAQVDIAQWLSQERAAGESGEAGQ